MGVNSDEKNDSTRGAAAAAAARGDETVLGTGAAGQPATAGSLLNMNLNYSTGLGSLNSNNYVQRYLDVFKKFLNERLGADWKGFNLHVLDSGSYQTVVSAIVVTYVAEHHGKKACGFHRILVEKSAGGKLPPIPMPVAGGQNLEIPATIGDVDVMQTSFFDIVSKMLANKIPGIPLCDAGSSVIPNELEPEDTGRLIRILFHAYQACVAMANNRVAPDQKIFQLSKIVKSDVLKAAVDNNPKPVETLGGLPIRSDLNATLNVSSGNNNDIATTNSRDIFSVDAFVDLVYAKPQANAFGGMMMMQPGMPQQQYAPRLIITKITNLLFEDYRMEMMLFGLLQSLIFNRNMMWSNVFNRRMKADDIHDIGALGYDMPSLVTNEPNGRGAKINTKSPTFTDKDLIDLIFRAIRPNLIYSIDIPEADDSSWMLNTFHHCAKGQMAAYDVIYNAANALTDGNFAKLFQKGKAIMIDEDTRIHNGYYQLGDGIRRDIRDYDYLAVLNHYGSSDPGAIAVWSATFDDRTNGNIYERAARRLSMIRDMAPGVVHTGWSQRHTIAPDFLNALHQAADNAGLVVRQGNVLGYNGVQQRGIQNADALGMQPLQGGIYSHVTMGTNNRGISSGPTWRQ